MQERMQSMLNGLTDKWKSFTKKQQWYIIGISAAIVLALGLTVFLMTRPDYIELFNDLNPGPLSQIEAALEAENIPYSYTNSGRGIKVEERYAINAKVIANATELTSRSGLKFADAIGTVTMSTTGKVLDETLLQVKKSEIEAQLMARSDISVAIVNLQLPDDSNFLLKQERTGTASVSVELIGQPTRQIGESIANIVAANCIDLKKEDVYVSDTNGNTLYSGAEADSITGELSTKQEIESIKEKNMIDRIESLLSSSGIEVVVAPNLVYDWTEATITQNTITSPDPESPNRGAVLEEHKERHSGTTENEDAEPGLPANDLEAGNNMLDDGIQESVNSSSQDVKLGYNTEEVIRNESAYGKLISSESSISAITYTDRRYNEATITPEELNGLTWEQFKEANNYRTKTTPDPDVIAAIQAASGIENVSLIEYITPIFIDNEVEPVQYETIIMFVILAILILLLAFAVIRKTQPDEITEIEPELSVEDLLVSTQLEEEQEMEVEKLRQMQEIEFNQDSETKQQIIKFVDEKPEAVAQLLRNWLNEDWE